MAHGHVVHGWWRRRRCLYAGWMVVAITRIPARTGFRLVRPTCDQRLTLTNAALSVTKLPHLVLFGIFFLLTVLQFPRVDRAAVVWSILATTGLGALVELQEGATRTGNCRVTDVLPDLAGALLGALLVTLVILGRRRTGYRVSGRP